MANIKSKYWRLELYPTKEQLDRLGLAKDYDGSAGYGTLPDDWEDILRQTCLPMAISPLHDKDTKPDGSVKKPHYHVVISYPSSNTTLKAVKERIADRLNAPTPFVADNPKGAYEYLWHKNDTDKYQYSKDEVKHYNGYTVPLSTDDIQILKGALQDFICEYSILEYGDFLDAVKMQFGVDSDEYGCATNYTILFNTYISSKRNKLRDQLERQEQTHNITPYPEQWEHYYDLWQNGNITNDEFLNQFGLKKGTMFNLIKRYKSEHKEA